MQVSALELVGLTAIVKAGQSKKDDEKNKKSSNLT